jgi:hypothetical protein
VVIPSLQGVAAAAIEIQPRASRYEDLQRVAVGVVESLQIVPPARELVQLVEDDETVEGNSRPRIRVRASSSSQERYRAGARG